MLARHWRQWADNLKLLVLGIGVGALALTRCVEALERPENALYELNFMRDLRARLRRKARLFPQHFDARGIGTGVSYEALHLCTLGRRYGYKEGDFPVTERIQEEVLSLPIFPGLTREQIDTVAGAIKEFFAKR